MFIEVIVKNEQEVRAAEEYGADRHELVSALSEGGLTPSYGAIRRVLAVATKPVMVMIRPHSQGYVYDQEDISIIMEDIRIAKELGAQGIVFGCLTKENTIDEALLAKVLKQSEGMEFTFHRAFDRIDDQLQAYRTLTSFGNQVKRILTSGGEDEAEAGKERIKELVHLSKQTGGPSILMGAGMTPANQSEMLTYTGASEVHFGIAFREQYLFKNNEKTTVLNDSGRYY